MADEQQVDKLYIEIDAKVKKALNKINELSSSVNKLEKSTHKAQKATSLWGKAFRSIGRIAFYRTIRTSIKLITQSAREGLNNLRTNNKQLDKSMNNISLSVKSLANSFGTLLMPFVNAFAPMVTKLSDGIANFANKISEAEAALRGEDQYTKILTSDTKEYQEQLEKTNKGLLAFDKFTSLKGENTYTGTKLADVTMSTEEAKKNMSSISTIMELLNDLGEVVKALWNSILKPVLEGLKNMIIWLKEKGSLVPMLEALIVLFVAIKSPFLALVSGVALLIGNWDKLRTSAKVLIPVLAGLLAVIAGVAVAIAGLGFGAAIKAAAIVGGIALVAGAAMSLKSYADGGVYEKGDYLKANENGKTELIASTNNGGGAVMNLQQWEKISEVAFYNALNRYGVAQGNGSGGTVVLDGKRVGELVEGSVYREGVRVGHWSRG